MYGYLSQRGFIELRKFALRVFGCQMNAYDGDRLRTAMIHRGWEEVTDTSADTVLLVTCSIREKAEQKVASEIGKYEAGYRKTGSPSVILVGCMAQRIGAEMAKKFQCVRLVSGPRHLGFVPQGIEDSLADGKPRFFFDEDPRALEDLSVVPTERTNPFKAYVTISYGCDRFCSYCIVPHVRGRLQSRSREEILSEIETLAASGVIEVSLLGQNVDAYGKDKKDGYSFAGLLDDVSRVSGIKRVRFYTSHPKDFDGDILAVMERTPSICRSINLPVQSGNDRILKEMNRGYTSADYLSLAERIRTALPGLSLTTDLIVGFPGETESEYEDSYRLLRDLRFDIVHTAAFSPRPGTRAAMMDGQLDVKTKAERLNRINNMQSAVAKELNAAYIGREVEILLDAPAPRGEGLLQGRTTTDKVVIVRAEPQNIGEFVMARVTGASHWSLEGELI